MQVEIYSDVVCPWCYIGKRRWEKALDHMGQHVDIDVVYRPFQLDPSAPSMPSPVIDTYAKKFGGVERATAIIDNVTAVAANEGLTFHLDIAQRANTMTAHRLLWFAETKGVQAEMKESLLRAYFVDGFDIANHKSLIRLAVEVGLDEVEVSTMLSSDQGLHEVTRQLAEAASRGITAVPTFVFNGEFTISGAQEPETFIRLLTKLLAVES
jgi:predicted DsbA family dithiol-disulfide isomerase